MDNNLQIFQNEQFGEIRTVLIDDELWFVGKDVASVLGYKDTADAIKKHVDDDDKGVCDLPTPGGLQKVTIINESGVYSLAFSSKLEKAKDFKRWVTRDILPSVRKTGAYIAPDSAALAPKSTAEMFLMQGQINVEFEQRLNKTDEKLNALTDQTAAIAEQTTALTARMDGVAKAFHRSDTVGEWKVETEMAIRELSTSINFRGRIYCELETRSGCSLNSRLTRARNRLRKNGMTLAQANKVNKLDIICMDKNLRNIFDGIIREHQAAAMAGANRQSVIDAEFTEVL